MMRVIVYGVTVQYPLLSSSTNYSHKLFTFYYYYSYYYQFGSVYCTRVCFAFCLLLWLRYSCSHHVRVLMFLQSASEFFVRFCLIVSFMDGIIE